MVDKMKTSLAPEKVVDLLNEISNLIPVEHDGKLRELLIQAYIWGAEDAFANTMELLKK